MFRELTRKNQALSPREIARILREETRGVLCVRGEDDYPYGVPMNYWYDEDSGRLYFHSGKKGHKVDALAAWDKVSFCVCDRGYRKPGGWAWYVSSVILFGRMRVVEDRDRAMELCRRMSLKYTDDLAYIEREIEKYGPATLCYELIPEHVTGKLVEES